MKLWRIEWGMESLLWVKEGQSYQSCWSQLPTARISSWNQYSFRIALLFSLSPKKTEKTKNRCRRCLGWAFIIRNISHTFHVGLINYSTTLLHSRFAVVPRASFRAAQQPFTILIIAQWLIVAPLVVCYPPRSLPTTTDPLPAYTLWYYIARLRGIYDSSWHRLKRIWVGPRPLYCISTMSAWLSLSLVPLCVLSSDLINITLIGLNCVKQRKDKQSSECL